MSAQPDQPSQTHPLRPSNAKTWKRLVFLIIAVVVASVALLLPILNPMISHSYSLQLKSDAYAEGKATLDPPTGSHVSGAWKTVSGDTVKFSILNKGRAQIYVVPSAAGGSFSFTATSPPYSFEDNSSASETVEVTGIYLAPVV